MHRIVNVLNTTEVFSYYVNFVSIKHLTLKKTQKTSIDPVSKGEKHGQAFQQRGYIDVK